MRSSLLEDLTGRFRGGSGNEPGGDSHERRRAGLARRRGVAEPGALAQRAPAPADGGRCASRSSRSSASGVAPSFRSGTAAGRRHRAPAGWRPRLRRASATGVEQAVLTAASGAGPGGGATTGTVTEVTAKTLYLTTSTGALVKVGLTAATTFTRTAKSPKGGLALGDTAIVIGSKNASGVLVATIGDRDAEGRDGDASAASAAASAAGSAVARAAGG